MTKSNLHPAYSPSQRQLRVGELIRRALSEILTRAEISDPMLEVHPITITKTHISPDLKMANVYFFPLGGKAFREVEHALSANSGELRRLVAKRVALKYAPRLQFYLDHSFDQMDEIQRLLDMPHVRRDLEAK